MREQRGTLHCAYFCPESFPAKASGLTGTPEEKIFLPLLTNVRLFLEAADRQQTSYSPNASAKETCKDIAESNHRASHQLTSRCPSLYLCPAIQAVPIVLISLPHESRELDIQIQVMMRNERAQELLDLSTNIYRTSDTSNR